MPSMNRQIPGLDQALQLFKRGAYPEAIELFQQIVAAEPRQPEPRLHLAKACLDWVQILTQVSLTELEPERLSDAGKQLLQLALTELHILAERHPTFPHVQTLLGIVHFVFDRPEEAVRCLRKALRKEPRNPDVLYNLGYVLLELELITESEMQFSRLTALYPEHGMGWQMLGQTRQLKGNSEAALIAYQHARRLLPDWSQPYGGVANALRDLRRYTEAKEVLRQGLVSHPENWSLNWALSSLALASEDWKTGWRYYACRMSASRRLPFEEGYVIPLQAGRPVKIQYDQGLGDELFFLRFVPALIAHGMTIHYTTQPKLFPVLQGCGEFSDLRVGNSDEAVEIDVLVGDLPYLTGMHSTTDAPKALALPVDAKKVDALANQLSAFGPPPYLGVTWQGGTAKIKGVKNLKALFKEISPTMLGKLARTWPGTVVLLQRFPRPDALDNFAKALGRAYLDWSHLNDDLTEAIAGLSLLDEYVGVSNTNMHLLAGIGKVARVLVPSPAEWRWMVDGDESPWFPGFHIYRQALDRSWDAALGRLKQDLINEYGQPNAPKHRPQ